VQTVRERMATMLTKFGFLLFARWWLDRVSNGQQVRSLHGACLTGGVLLENVQKNYLAFAVCQMSLSSNENKHQSSLRLCPIYDVC
jgi:hypothetical protein